MKKINLYRYEDANGVVVITPTPKAETDTPSRIRLIAEEKRILTNGETETVAIDIMLNEVDSWSEKEFSENQSDLVLNETEITIENYRAALAIIAQYEEKIKKEEIPLSETY